MTSSGGFFVQDSEVSWQVVCLIHELFCRWAEKEKEKKQNFSFAVYREDFYNNNCESVWTCLGCQSLLLLLFWNWNYERRGLKIVASWLTGYFRNFFEKGRWIITKMITIITMAVLRWKLWCVIIKWHLLEKWILL